jgi:hypothetical protein
LASHPPAVPAISDRLASAFEPSAVPGGQLPASPGVASGAPPSESASGLRRILLLQLRLRTNFQLFVVTRSSGCTFRSTSSLRRPPTFQSCHRTRPPAFAGHRILQLYLRTRSDFHRTASSGSAFQPSLRLFIGYCVLRLHLPTDPPTFIGHRPSGCALRLTSGFHRHRIFGLSLCTRPPTCIGTRILRFCQRLIFVFDGV